MKSHIIEKCEEDGEFDTLEDGFVYWFPNNKGAVSSQDLRNIADELDARNAEWSKVLDNFLSQYKLDNS